MSMRTSVAAASSGVPYMKLSRRVAVAWHLGSRSLSSAPISSIKTRSDAVAVATAGFQESVSEKVDAQIGDVRDFSFTVAGFWDKRLFLFRLAEQFSQYLDRGGYFTACLISDASHSQQPTHGDRQQVFNGQDVRAIECVGRPSSQSQLPDCGVKAGIGKQFT